MIGWVDILDPFLQMTSDDDFTLYSEYVWGLAEFMKFRKICDVLSGLSCHGTRKVYVRFFYNCLGQLFVLRFFLE